MNKTPPDLSVVIVTRDDARTLQPILTALSEQSIAHRIEVVITAPDEERGTPEPRFTERFHSLRVVPVGPIGNRGRAAASGVRDASAPVVALSENHCFPHPEWAERTLRTHATRACSGVGPAVLAANPETNLSRVAYATGYGRFRASDPPGLRDELPLHNSSFRREVLVPRFARLEDLLADERRLHAELVDERQHLWFEPSCLKWHINEATWGLLLGLAWCGGRRYAGIRRGSWPIGRRVAYAALFPALVLPIARGIWRRVEQAHRRGGVGPRIEIPTLAYSLTQATGEAVGYLFGSPAEFRFVEDEEFFIRDRMGSVPMEDPVVSRFVAMLDT